MPIFSGVDPDGWTVKMERYFDINRFSPAERLEADIIALDGNALAWWQWTNKLYTVRTWEEMKVLVVRQYRPPQLGSLCSQFLRVRQSGSVDDYIRRFIELSAPLNDISAEIYLETYLKGLKDEIASELIVLNPSSLSRAMELSLLAEAKVKMQARFKPYHSNGPGKVGPDNLKPLIIANPTRGTEVQPETALFDAKFGENHGQPFRKLTEEEIRDKRRRGLCFRCDGKYEAGHVCARPEMEILLVQDDPAAAEEVGEQEVIVFDPGGA